jgi:hypothetical protein
MGWPKSFMDLMADGDFEEMLKKMLSLNLANFAWKQSSFN